MSAKYHTCHAGINDHMSLNDTYGEFSKFSWQLLRSLQVKIYRHYITPSAIFCSSLFRIRDIRVFGQSRGERDRFSLRFPEFTCLRSIVSRRPTVRQSFRRRSAISQSLRKLGRCQPSELWWGGAGGGLTQKRTFPCCISPPLPPSFPSQLSPVLLLSLLILSPSKVCPVLYLPSAFLLPQRVVCCISWRFAAFF